MNKKLIACLVFFTLLHIIFFFTRHHDIHWDEAVYISMAKYLYSFGSVGLFESIRPLGLALVLGFFWKIGAGIEMYQTVELLFALGILLLTYMLGKKIADEQSAVLATAFLAITPFFFFNSIQILTEIPAAFFILLSVYLFAEQKYFTAGITAGIAFLFKFPAGILFLGLFCIAVLEKKYRKSIVVFAGFVIVQIPYLVFNYISYAPFTATAFDALFRPFLLAESHASNWLHAIAGTWQNILYYPLALVMDNPLLIFALPGFFLLRKQKYIAFPLAFFFLYFTYITNKQLRFAVLFLPFIALYAGAGIFYLQKALKKYISYTVFYCIIILLTIPVIYPSFVAAYRFFPAEELAIEQEYYSFFREGVILTTEPYFSAYTNILAIPYYNNVTDAQEIYEKFKDNVNYIVFSPEFYPCTDEQCQQQIAALGTEIGKLPVIYQHTWNGNIKTIYLNKDLK